MPTINRSGVSKPKTAKLQSSSSKIRSVKESNYGIKINLYGRGKTGKTTLACDFPKPLLIVGTMGTLEDGTRSVADLDDVDFYPLENSEEMEEVCKIVANDGYKTVVLDTAGGLQDMKLKEYLRLDEVPVQKTWGMATREDWQVIGAQTKEHLRSLLNLAMTPGVYANVVIVAHERAFEPEKNMEGIKPVIGSALSPAVAGWLNGACDYICQCFIEERTKEKVNVVGKKQVRVKVKTGEFDYCLRIGPHSVFLTGFRKPKGLVLPDVIIDPTYAKIKSLIDGVNITA